MFEIAGLPPGTDIPMNIPRKVLHPDDLVKFLEARARRSKTRTTSMIDLRWVRPDRENRRVHMNINPRFDGSERSRRSIRHNTGHHRPQSEGSAAPQRHRPARSRAADCRHRPHDRRSVHGSIRLVARRCGDIWNRSGIDRTHAQIHAPVLSPGRSRHDHQGGRGSPFAGHPSTSARIPYCSSRRRGADGLSRERSRKRCERTSRPEDRHL